MPIRVFKVAKKILITPRSFGRYKDTAYPLIEIRGYEIIENTQGRTLTEEDLVEYAKEDIEGIIVGIDPLPAPVLDRFRSLRAISKYGVGMDNIDLKRANELGIRVRNAIGANDVSVAELTIALMFAAARSIPLASATVKNGGWEREIGFALTGKKLGLVGGGRIGKKVAMRCAKGLEMEVAIYDPYLNDEAFLNAYRIHRYGDIRDLFRNSDVVSLHVPLTSETGGIINRKTLQLMKPTAILVNTSRGELVDEDALHEALTKGEINVAAQDVFSSEPPAKNDKLLGLKNFILTPHIGAFTNEAVERMVMLSTQNLLEMLAEEDGVNGRVRTTSS